MAGIYLHIPFCKQACHYCDFHFSTSLKKKEALVNALCKELILRKEELSDTVQTIYFGGGTPSLLSTKELNKIFKTIYDHYTVSETAEITLEANPDDLTEEYVVQLSRGLINRLSIGVQSFFEEDLKLMNRAHNVQEAVQCIAYAKDFFENISIDLIYGIPGMTDERWLKNLRKAMDLDIPHLSCYALTVEPKTALKSFIEKGLVDPVDDEMAQAHHAQLIAHTEQGGYANYEFSNFGKPGFESQNNMAYWMGKPYLGIGPSAHSYDGNVRAWNVANNIKYIKEIEEGNLPQERESLTTKDKYNEYVMTRLRTQNGIRLSEVQDEFGSIYKDYLMQQATAHLRDDLLILEGDRMHVTKKGKFLSDGIASDLFMLQLG
ncbi:radical SAM family heme chaperone HemW [Aureisphaera galaxeae]|uniref:radical SAM family heme chaperone HemW n=1 Tax=Aureisphaera galaxeae TaxID=1538023 RepID=UPI00234FED19|nr:radical SAM family heme chaperone HemW [Aureisphaera galaxeae]MDC8002874.1 radical SAM family heme chaperone HemW [Aureisphaera galaxeae]